VTSLGSVLVVRLSALGDVLFALPAVQALARSGRARRITWVVEERAAALLAGAPGLDARIDFPRRRKASWPGHVRRLRREAHDLVLDLQGNLKSRVHVTLARAPRKVGYDRPLAKEGSQHALTERFTPPPGARHRVDGHLALLASLGVPVPAPAPRPELGLATTAPPRPPPGDGPLVLLHPGTSAFGRLKRWPAERFGALGRLLRARHGARLVLTAGPGEGELADRAEAALGARCLRPPPEGLAALAGWLTAADLVVAADSLPLHLANALGTPVVGLYGPKDPAVTGPYWDRARVVRSDTDCSPCTLRRCAEVLCMERLRVEAVAAACDALLGDAPPA